MTSREVLERFYPAHGMHSIVHVAAAKKGVVLGCSCGTEGLTITEAAAKRETLTMEEVKHFVRNAPRRASLTV